MTDESGKKGGGAMLYMCSLAFWGARGLAVQPSRKGGGGGFSLFFFDERRWLRESLVCLTAVSTHGARNPCKSRRGSL